MFPGGKGGRCVGLTTLPPHVPIVLKSGSLKLLEPSRPVIGMLLPVSYYNIHRLLNKCTLSKLIVGWVNSGFRRGMSDI
jgi:hypothetical protein